MSLNNSILTRASRKGEFCSDSSGYRKGQDYVDAVKFYGMQRKRPIFSKLPDWLWNLWSGGDLRPFPEAGEDYLQLSQPDGNLKIIKPGCYLVCTWQAHYTLSLTIVPADTFEAEYKPIVCPK